MGTVPHADAFKNCDAIIFIEDVYPDTDVSRRVDFRILAAESLSTWDGLAEIRDNPEVRLRVRFPSETRLEKGEHKVRFIPGTNDSHLL